MLDLRRNLLPAIAMLALGAGTALATDEPDDYQFGGRGGALVKPGVLAKFIAWPAYSLDLPDVPGNDPTVEGGTLKFYEIGNPTNADTYVLPAAGWRAIGDPAAPTGFRFRGARVPGHPCRVVQLRATGLKGVCRGSAVTLTPPIPSYFLGVTLTVGSGSKRYCPAYAALLNVVGRYKGTPAIVPHEQVCSPSGAFLDGR